MPRRAPKSPKPQASSFGLRLKLLRKQRGLTQAALAKKVGSIQALISRYEHDEVRPQSTVLARLAATLGVSTDELLGVSLPQNAESGGLPSRRFLRRIQLIEKLPKRDQDALLRTIDAFLTARGAAALLRS
jgi:transcriptional regulator with XRE-family HTH domain